MAEVVMKEGLWVCRFYEKFVVHGGRPPEPVTLVDLQVQEGRELLGACHGKVDMCHLLVEVCEKCLQLVMVS